MRYLMPNDVTSRDKQAELPEKGDICSILSLFRQILVKLPKNKRIQARCKIGLSTKNMDKIIGDNKTIIFLKVSIFRSIFRLHSSLSTFLCISDSI